MLSATFLENLENVIFVEAYKIEHVRETLDGLNMCYCKIDLLKTEEMTKIYENLDQELQRPEEGHWVRIKSGKYQGDLGIISKYFSDESIWVKLIPRIDPTDWLPRSQQPKKASIFQRSAQRPFSQ